MREYKSFTDGPPIWPAVAVIAIAIFAVYGHALDVPFILDDDPAIVSNPSIVSLLPLGGTAEHPGPLRPVRGSPTVARPLVNLSFALNYQFGGLNPIGYHAVNVLIHFCSAILLWAIVRRTLLLPYFNGRFTGAAGWLALLVALLWALHPLQTEAVIYATQRTELMVASFYLATLYCSLRYWALDAGAPRDAATISSEGKSSDRRHTKWLLLAVGACLCGMASKEVMFAAPIVILLFERTFIADSLSEAYRRSRSLYLGLVATWILLVGLNLGAPRGASAGFHLGISPFAWWFTQCKVLLLYLKLAIWPSPLLLHYELPYLNSFSDAWMFVVPVVLLALLAILLVARNSPVGFLLTAMALILAPTFLVPIPTEMAAERRMHLPLAALVVLFVVGCYSLAQAWFRKAEAGRPERAVVVARFALLVPAALVIVGYGIASAARLTDYYDETRLWQQVLAHQPNNYLAHYNLGIIFNHAGREAESLVELKAAVAANPNYPPAQSALGFALINAGRLPDALNALDTALAIAPDYVPAINNMGLALLEMGNYSDAVDVLQHALRLDPSNALALTYLGRARLKVGQSAESVEALQAALAVTPNDPDVLNNLAMALSAQIRLPEAIKLLRRAVELRPDFAAAHNNLGIALHRAGDMPGATEHFRKFIELRPQHPGGYGNLANVAASQGDFDQAAELFAQAIQLQPNSAEGHFSLGFALMQIGKSNDAIEHFQTAIRLKPRLLPAYVNLANALVHANREDEAVQIAKQGLEAARAAGDSTSTTQLEDWLKQHKNN